MSINVTKDASGSNNLKRYIVLCRIGVREPIDPSKLYSRLNEISFNNIPSDIIIKSPVEREVNNIIEKHIKDKPLGEENIKLKIKHDEYDRKHHGPLYNGSRRRKIKLSTSMRVDFNWIEEPKGLNDELRILHIEAKGANEKDTKEILERDKIAREDANEIFSPQMSTFFKRLNSNMDMLFGSHVVVEEPVGNIREEATSESNKPIKKIKIKSIYVLAISFLKREPNSNESRIANQAESNRLIEKLTKLAQNPFTKLKVDVNNNELVVKKADSSELRDDDTATLFIKGQMIIISTQDLEKLLNKLKQLKKLKEGKDRKLRAMEVYDYLNEILIKAYGLRE
ncbi:MAG: hypothetical protein ARM1_0640 [Candidatus Micrarchaeota archaeon]|nr:MAG: hypothetical protein ARM1_0640 [Candidatus Micrarchaeota archaeon]